MSNLSGVDRSAYGIHAIRHNSVEETIHKT